MKFQIQHTTHYQYDGEVADSVNEIRLSPRTNGSQSCYQHSITTYPHAPLFVYEDYFGNRVHAFSISEPHTELTITARSVVVTSDAMTPRTSILPFEQEQAIMKSDAFQDQFAEYLAPTDYTQNTTDVQQIAHRFLSGSVESVSQLLAEVTTAIKKEYIYDPAATQVQTKIDEMIKIRRGVCQDFAHLMLALCRCLGIPARYVSGYQYISDLSGGNADFEQASHAWIEAYIPDVGWTGFDPTNDVPVGWRYIILAYGRDYKDIVPVKGVYHGTPRQNLKVDVDVKKLADIV
ncbi:transglutaminase family protein [Sporolactobacillus sp. STSJ-5]|uniref:transglutaminase family protein n=1 Tax=Sporolactobacillus sp. STSJ-5 TaxID=2965076 RepID=UPI002102465C|nr:transglutaminase family protein [Sporolactobacillus sp. STSJ-5]MCQ2011654.1 transglutaminase family protein [Sporolactobacillus sp. STSJ-5]